MIPKIIHYCWFGKGPMPDLAVRCIESWHKYMPDWEYVLWNEDNFDVDSYPYAREAYEAKKYAFVSDVARLKALKEQGGVYFDVDFEVYKPFDDLLHHEAFAGFEGSKHHPVMMGVLGSVPEGDWVSGQLKRYENRHFILDGKPDLTTNVRFVTDGMMAHGFVPDGREQDCMGMHIYPVDYFCPRLTTGEYRRTDNTYCEQKGDASSWARLTPKDKLFKRLPTWLRVFLIKTKRAFFG
jgi:hypothetical protein